MELNKTKVTTSWGLGFFFGEPSENQIRVEKREIPESEVEGYIGNCEISLASKMEKKLVAVANLIMTKIRVD